MPTIMYAGYIHAQVDALRSLIEKAEAGTSPETSDGQCAIIQVGDLGWGFPGRAIEQFLQERAQQATWTVPIYTCFGNHDNWDLLETLRKESGSPDLLELAPGSGCYYVARGATASIVGIEHLFLGGAESTDRINRTEGVDWWPT